MQVGAPFGWGAWASHCRGFSCCGAWALGHVGSVAVVRAQLLPGRDLPRPGLNPHLVLGGGFLTTGPLGRVNMGHYCSEFQFYKMREF